MHTSHGGFTCLVCGMLSWFGLHERHSHGLNKAHIATTCGLLKTTTLIWSVALHEKPGFHTIQCLSSTTCELSPVLKAACYVGILNIRFDW